MSDRTRAVPRPLGMGVNLGNWPQSQESYGLYTRMSDAEIDALLAAPLVIREDWQQREQRKRKLIRRASAARGSGER